MRQEPCRAWGYLFPAGEAVCRAVNEVMEEWHLPSCAEPDREGGIHIAFEGATFPLDEVVAAVTSRMEPTCSGKIDVCDMERWTLTRALFAGKDVRLSMTGLNNVLAYSGH